MILISFKSSHETLQCEGLFCSSEKNQDFEIPTNTIMAKYLKYPGAKRINHLLQSVFKELLLLLSCTQADSTHFGLLTWGLAITLSWDVYVNGYTYLW